MDGAPETSAFQAVEELRGCYEAFAEKLEACCAANVGEAMGFLFRAQGNPKVGYAVEEFNAVVTRRVADLAERLTLCPAEQAGRLAEQAMELMLFYPQPRNNTISFSLAAFEGHARPLVRFLPAQRRQELARRYARRTPPRRMLPNQNKLWQALVSG